MLASAFDICRSSVVWRCGVYINRTCFASIAYSYPQCSADVRTRDCNDQSAASCWSDLIEWLDCFVIVSNVLHAVNDKDICAWQVFQNSVLTTKCFNREPIALFHDFSQHLVLSSRVHLLAETIIPSPGIGASTVASGTTGRPKPMMQNTTNNNNNNSLSIISTASTNEPTMTFAACTARSRRIMIMTDLPGMTRSMTGKPSGWWSL